MDYVKKDLLQMPSTREDYDMMLGDVLILNGWDGLTGDYMPSIKIMFDFG